MLMMKQRRMATPIYRAKRDIERMKLHIAVGFVAGFCTGAIIVQWLNDAGVIQ